MEGILFDNESKREELRRKKLVEEIVKDFEERREARRSIENGWVLNMNFVSGNQYCDVSPFGEIVEEEKRFYWQTRRVFNHIAPLVDARVAKLLKRKPNLKVRAFSDEDGDVKSAKLASGILRYVKDRIGLEEILTRGTVWSETCGTVFYKTLWNDKGGRQVGVDEQNAPVYEGEVELTVAPPFEIFPDRLDAESLDDIGSLIHAQAVSVGYVLEKFGVTLKAEVREAKLVYTAIYQSLDDHPVVNNLLNKYKDIISKADQALGNNRSTRNSTAICNKVAELYYRAGVDRWGKEYKIVLGGGFLNTRSPYNIYAGPVKYGDLQMVLPFDNQIVLCSIKGSELLSKFIYTNNSRYYISLSDYGTDIINSIDKNATYYIITDTYCSSYAANRLTVIDTYDQTTFARDLIAEYIKDGNWSK